jgi:hypothetical protein
LILNLWILAFSFMGQEVGGAAAWLCVSVCWARVIAEPFAWLPLSWSTRYRLV